MPFLNDKGTKETVTKKSGCVVLRHVGRAGLLCCVLRTDRSSSPSNFLLLLDRAHIQLRAPPETEGRS